MNVKIARIKKRMNQEDVCKRVGISKTTLSKIENGKLNSIKYSVMIKLAETLDESVEKLFFNEEAKEVNK